MREVLVWGAGGHGRVVADLARSNGYSVVGYADRNRELLQSPNDALGSRVVASEEEIGGWLDQDQARILVLGIGDNAVRLAGSRLYPDVRLPPIVHPACVVAGSVVVGPGSTVMAGAILNANVRVGRGAIINTGAILEHDVQVSDGAHVSPGAVLAGGSSVGEGGWVGANATVLPLVRVGAGAIVGAGAVVLEDVPDGATVAGNPARILR
jgi:sugar O-acyltransferase (sialic acid O-acetyltransferase NeuD family)